VTRRTNPLQWSPPLPEDWSFVGMPTQKVLIDEARRAALELVWALHRQRTSWAKLAKVKALYGDKNIDFLDNERPYKLAVGDVQWWRGEVSSRANALTALLAAAATYETEE